MKKTYITTVPDRIGAFLKASRCFRSLGMNITRVSYNKAVDTNTLFIDAEGTPEQHAAADDFLLKAGYLHDHTEEKSVVLLEFHFKDESASVTDVFILIDEFKFNICYISLQENSTDPKPLKVGLFVDDADKVSEFINSAEALCSVRVIDYNRSEKVYDNSIFYKAFVSGLAERLALNNKEKNDLLVYANLAMQTLDEQGLSPYKTFNSISRFAELLAAGRGNGFKPKVTHHKITDNTEIILIEPPCGSNTAIIKSFGEVLFIDSGYALYKNEMLRLFYRFVPDLDRIKKRVFITHADVDHCGLLPLFDEVLASQKTAECLKLEYEGKDGFREQNPLHKPYIKMCKILSAYRPPDPKTVKALWGRKEESEKPLSQVGFFDFGELHFEVYEGKGGHILGETVLIDYAHHIAFTGDIYINLREMTPEQAEYNRYAPILTTSVDTDAKLCALERAAVLGRLGAGSWQIFGAHGHKKNYTVNVE